MTTTGAEQNHKATIQGTVVALYTLLGVFGALACTFLGDYLGRRKTIWLSCLVNAIGCILMATSYQFSQFIVSRIIVGLGTGGIIATVSVWQTETAKGESLIDIRPSVILTGASLQPTVAVNMSAASVYSADSDSSSVSGWNLAVPISTTPHHGVSRCLYQLFSHSL